MSVLILNKPKGLTSFQAVLQVKKLLNLKKAGHSGTLDPLATGLLPIFFDESTYFIKFLSNENKEYIASFVFDISSNTEDITGSIQYHNNSKEIDKNTFVKTLELFKGKSTQTPPKFSAKKVNGVPMYKLARAGKEFEVKPQNIEIFNLELIDYNYPKFTFKTLVSKGTYIRTLGVDIAKKLGKFCCLTDLQRTRIGSIKLKESIDINTLKSLDNVSKMKYVKRIEEILRKFPKVSLSSSEVKKFQNGSFVRVEDQKMHNECFVFFKDELMGYGLIDENKNLHPKRVINRRN